MVTALEVFAPIAVINIPFALYQRRIARKVQQMLPNTVSFGNNDTAVVHIIAASIVIIGFLGSMTVLVVDYIRDPNAQPPAIIVSTVFALIVAGVQAFGGQQGKSNAVEGYKLANQAQQQTVQTVKDIAQAAPTVGGGGNAQTN